MSDLWRAQRVDRETGIREIAEFYEVEHTRVFGFTHLPPEKPRGGVVVCSPVYAEFIRNYRREVVVARRLAALGIAVQRFDYRGHGNSGGNPAKTTFETMVSDATAAADRLADLADQGYPSYFGTRFGGLIAAASSRRDALPVAMWDPVLEPIPYLHSIFRARRVQALRAGRQGRTTSEALFEQLERVGSVPVLGHTIYRSLHDSSRARTLEHEMGSVARPLLVVRMGRDHRADAPLEDLIGRWCAFGFDVTDEVLARREAWWFTSGPETSKEVVADASDVTVEWLTQAVEGVAR